MLVLILGCRTYTGKPVDTGAVLADTSSMDTAPVETVDTDGAFIDADGDGFDETTDCDDADASSYPGAEEVCDGADNDCDCLLYTSPSPRDLTTSRMPSSA